VADLRAPCEQILQSGRAYVAIDQEDVAVPEMELVQMGLRDFFENFHVAYSTEHFSFLVKDGVVGSGRQILVDV